MEKRPWRYWLLWLYTFPVDLLVTLFVLLMRLFWGHRLDWNEGLWCELRPDSWPTRTWYRYKVNGAYVELPAYQQGRFGRWKTWGGTTLGHGGFYGPGRLGDKGLDQSVELHEHVHVEQYEVAMFVTLILGLAVYLLTAYASLPVWGLCIGVWLSGYLLMAIGGWFVAWMRGEKAYAGSAHEEAAYALVEQYMRDKDK